MGPGALKNILSDLPQFEHPDLLVSGSGMDDAGVIRLDNNVALVQTLDFFTPIVDEPYIFGQIAAANAFSDIYAMGARPLTALNITSFPTCSLDLEILRDILKGGADKIKEAGALLVGGHTVEDKEPKYGLAVTGVVDPKDLLRNDCARDGDVLVLTKPIGTGIITTAAKGDLAPSSALDEAVKSMVKLNKTAAEVLAKFQVNACTDITGFGLLGHAYEMALGSGVTMIINSSRVPLLKNVSQLAGMGLVPAGARRNLEFIEEQVEWEVEITPEMRDILNDPQTSGGLLAAVPAADADEIVSQLHRNGETAAAVGRVIRGRPGCIKVK